MSIMSAFIERCSELWDKTLTHPFVAGIGDGTLPVEKFRFYLVQDYHYLIAYCRAVAAAAYKAPNVETMREMSGLLHSTLETEMSLHRAYAAEFGIASDELDKSSPAPTTTAYASYMLDIAARRDFLANLVCILPCAVGYAEIGAKLKMQTGTQASPYQAWIDMYAGAEFQAYATRLAEIVEEEADGLPARAIEDLFDVFATSTRYEWMFWEMAWTHEKWPVQAVID